MKAITWRRKRAVRRAISLLLVFAFTTVTMPLPAAARATNTGASLKTGASTSRLTPPGNVVAVHAITSANATGTVEAWQNGAWQKIKGAVDAKNASVYRTGSNGSVKFTFE